MTKAGACLKCSNVCQAFRLRLGHPKFVLEYGMQGTAASKKKKKAKLQRVMATVKRAARKGRADNAQSFAAIQLLHDPQVVKA